jgi:hypothetical protein
MIIAATLIIMSVNHAQIAGEFLNYTAQIAGKLSMPGIQAHADRNLAHRCQNPEQITYACEEQVRKLIFDGTSNTNLATMLCNLSKHVGGKS